jgi:hypothetical protein
MTHDSELRYRIIDKSPMKFWVVDQRGDAELGNWFIAEYRFREHARSYCDFLNATATPPPSGDAVRLVDYEEFMEAVSEGAKWGTLTREEVKTVVTFAKKLRALPATPVNPPSAERGEALRELEHICSYDVWHKAENLEEKIFWWFKEYAATVRAALSAPVTDTGWIDEMRNAGHSDLVMDEDYYIGYNAALDAVKQKLDGRG